jgi:hypothetical protein
MYPNYDPLRPGFLNAVETYHQAGLIGRLSFIESEKVDEAVARVFRALDWRQYEVAERVWADQLAFACMDRLIGKGMDRDFEAYCLGRLEDLKQRKREVEDVLSLKWLEQRLGTIRSSIGDGN